MHALNAGPCSAAGVACAIILNRALQENTEGSSCGSGGTLWFRCAGGLGIRQWLAGLHSPPVAARAAGGSLRGLFHGRHFQFRVLPFGLSLSPRVFTRFVAAALSSLQA
ncbi:hypothetical protein AMECASPLE_019815 [Ameca splendens]|uniref:Secreted protein n=1 Tax=Ameca splendens TaxID=208324 RepID=A0ABV1ABN8_9TELE